MEKTERFYKVILNDEDPATYSKFKLFVEKKGSDFCLSIIDCSKGDVVCITQNVSLIKKALKASGLDAEIKMDTIDYEEALLFAKPGEGADIVFTYLHLRSYGSGLFMDPHGNIFILRDFVKNEYNIGRIYQFNLKKYDIRSFPNHIAIMKKQSNEPVTRAEADAIFAEDVVDTLVETNFRYLTTDAKDLVKDVIHMIPKIDDRLKAIAVLNYILKD